MGVVPPGLRVPPPTIKGCPPPWLRAPPCSPRARCPQRHPCPLHGAGGTRSRVTQGGLSGCGGGHFGANNGGFTFSIPTPPPQNTQARHFWGRAGTAAAGPPTIAVPGKVGVVVVVFGGGPGLLWGGSRHATSPPRGAQAGNQPHVPGSGGPEIRHGRCGVSPFPAPAVSPLSFRVPQMGGGHTAWGAPGGIIPPPQTPAPGSPSPACPDRLLRASAAPGRGARCCLMWLHSPPHPKSYGPPLPTHLVVPGLTLSTPKPYGIP